MIVYQNKLITLTHIPDLDILIVAWHTLESYCSEKTKESLEKVIEAIHDFKCQYLLLDASQANLVMDIQEFRNFVIGFLEDIAKAGVQKVARIRTLNLEREENMESIRSEFEFSFQSKDFKKREEALEWLKHEKRSPFQPE